MPPGYVSLFMLSISLEFFDDHKPKVLKGTFPAFPVIFGVIETTM